MEKAINNLPVLVIRGILSDKSINDFKSGLPEHISSNSLVVFTDYALANFHIGEVFTKVFSIDNIDEWSETHCEIVAVTQQFNRPMDEISRGWKTVCILKFLDYIPEIINMLPLSDHTTWGSSENRLGLSNDKTWIALLSSDKID